MAKPVHFELPNDISEEDEQLLTGILGALCSLEVCCQYKVEVIPSTGYLIRGALPEEHFEVNLEQMLLLSNANFLRIENVLVSRSKGNSELLIKVLNSKQKVMLTHSSTYIVYNKKRKVQPIPSR